MARLPGISGGSPGAATKLGSSQAVRPPGRTFERRYLVESIWLAPAPAHRRISPLFLDPRQCTGVSIPEHPVRKHAGFRCLAAGRSGFRLPGAGTRHVVRGRAGADLGACSPALGTAHPAVCRGGGSSTGRRMRRLLRRLGPARSRPFGRGHLLGTGAGVRPFPPLQRVDGCVWRSGVVVHTGSNQNSRFSGEALSRPFGVPIPGPAERARSHVRPMGRLPDLPPVSFPTRVFRWPERFLRRRDGRGLPGIADCRPALAGNDGPLSL